VQEFTFTYTDALITHWFIKITVSGSSVIVVSGYGLDHRAIEVRSLAGTKGFFI
jgi:hypothetical protein